MRLENNVELSGLLEGIDDYLRSLARQVLTSNAVEAQPPGDSLESLVRRHRIGQQ